MSRSILMLAIFWFGSLCLGCAPEVTPDVPSSSGPAVTAGRGSAVPPLPTAMTPAPAEAAAPSESPSAAVPPAPPAPNAPAPTESAPAPAPQPRIRLSTGVALAQTLPQGTTVLCSMDYQWTQGGPEPGVEYVWVVKLGDGRQMTGRADVAKPRGTIQLVLNGVRPENGPFQGAVAIRSTSGGANPLRIIADFVELPKG